MARSKGIVSRCMGCLKKGHRRDNKKCPRYGLPPLGRIRNMVGAGYVEEIIDWVESVRNGKRKKDTYV
jgi:hypothetical protein